MVKQTFKNLQTLEIRGNKLKSLGFLDIPTLKYLWAVSMLFPLMMIYTIQNYIFIIIWLLWLTLILPTFGIQADNKLTSLGQLRSLVNLESFHGRSNSFTRLDDFPAILPALKYINLR